MIENQFSNPSAIMESGEDDQGSWVKTVGQ